jgi:hypothetical protein
VGFAVFETIAVMKYPVGGSLPSLLAAGIIYYVLSVRRRPSR